MNTDDEQIIESIVPDAALNIPIITEASNPIEPGSDLSLNPAPLTPTVVELTPVQSAPPVNVDALISEPTTPNPIMTEPVSELKNEPAFNPVIEPEKPTEVAPKPEPAPVIPVPITTPAVTPIPEPAKPFDINSLSDEQLKAAAALYTKRNQAEISRKGVAKRQETMELNLREIVDFLSLNNGSPLPRIAKRTNITLGTTSKYLRQLQSKGKVRAEGWGKTRRYYLK